jgi:hypothetical protein
MGYQGTAARERGAGMTTNAGGTIDDGRRKYILAEFRCALIKARLAQCDIEAVAAALELRIVTPEQAAELFWDSPSIQFLGLKLNKGGQ